MTTTERRDGGLGVGPFQVIEMDPSGATSECHSQPLVDGLRYMTNAFVWERDIVDLCTARRMDHVVRGLGSGEVAVPGHGLLSTVNYIIFEEATRGDSRRHLDAMAAIEHAWVLRALHNIANGLRQLHQEGIAHGDLKPSNVLVFDDAVKIGDLGRASRADQPSPHEPATVLGDRTYAPPELLYEAPDPDLTLRRRACDAYHLGSLLRFFFTKVGTTPALAMSIDPAFWCVGWGGTFEDALPHLREAFDAVTVEFAEAVPSGLRGDLVALFKELCDPDPRLRGNAKVQTGRAQRYSMERYVSRFDNLASRAETRLRSALSA
jgi:serine/threonine protein kinase